MSGWLQLVAALVAIMLFWLLCGLITAIVLGRWLRYNRARLSGRPASQNGQMSGRRQGNVTKQGIDNADQP